MFFLKKTTKNPQIVKLNENCSHYFDKSTLASFEVLYLIAKNKIQPTTGQTLLLPTNMKNVQNYAL
jgi:hypothetical protein